MFSEFLKKLRWFLLGPQKTAGKNIPAQQVSSIFPLRLPLNPDEIVGWKSYPLFKRKLPGRYMLSSHASSLMPGHSPHAPHSHPEEEILIMLDGEADLLGPEDASPLKIKPGDFIYYPAGFPHSLRSSGYVPANYLMFKWKGKYVGNEKILENLLLKDISLFPDERPVDKISMKRLFEGPTGLLSKLHCHLTHLPPGKGYPAHKDRYDVAIVILEGAVETMGSTAEPYDVIFYSAGEPHGMHNPGMIPAKYLVFEFHFDKPISGKR